MGLTVVSVAYAQAPVGPDTAGGAEQILWLSDRELSRRGHRSIVVAAEGASVHGTLVPFRPAAGLLDEAARAAAEARAREAAATAILRYGPDVVHMHGLDFAVTLPPTTRPVVVSLHLPADHYGQSLAAAPDNVRFLPVSRSQAARLPPLATVLPPIENGIDVEALAGTTADVATPTTDPSTAGTIPFAPGSFVLMLARICPEKGIHLAMDAARAAGVPFVLAGEAFPYPAHVAYLEAEIRPRLGPSCRWVGPVGLAGKRALLAAARCLIVASTVAETSSLVAREAAAAGTPVVALDRGALGETVEHGFTGLVVPEPGDLAAAIRAVGRIDPAVCRAAARRRFSAARMAEETIALYRRLIADMADDATGTGRRAS